MRVVASAYNVAMTRVKKVVFYCLIASVQTDQRVKLLFKGVFWQRGNPACFEQTMSECPMVL